MKKLIQLCTVLSLVVVFSVVAANAQTVNKRYEANVPFDFNIGQKNYQAGNYVIKIVKNSESTLRLTIQDDKQTTLQTLLVFENGDVAKGEPQLIFNKYENRRFLAGVLTAERGVNVLKSSEEKEVARNFGKYRSGKPVVAVKLEE